MLNDKQRRFVEEYLVDLNATQAAIRAGYSQDTAYSQGQRLLKHVEVSAEIQSSMAERSKRTQITADRVLKELAKIGFADIRKAVKWYSQTNVAAVDADYAEGEVEDGSLRFAVANQVELVSCDEIDDDTAAAIAEISMSDKGGLKLKLHDKRAALVDLGKHLKLFTDKVEHTGKDGGPIEFERVREDADAVAGALARLAERARAPGVDEQTQH